MKTLFTHATIVTMAQHCPVISRGFLAVDGGKISYLGDTPPCGTFDRVIDATDKVLMPGLVNAHTHLPMTLMRGYGGGCDLHTWLNQYIFPAEARLDKKSVRIGTTLALAELIASGVTTVADMYYFCDEIAAAVVQAGISANLSRSLVSFSADDTPEKMQSYQEMVQLYETWHGYQDGQILVDTSIHAEYTSFENPRLWESVAQFAADRHLGVQIHISETESEHADCLARHGKTPLALFDQYGMWRTGRSLAAHCVHITQEDMDLMAQRFVCAVHNPVSNLKLASGIAPIPEMMERGVSIALGTDGVSSNNSHDMFEEIKLAAMLHKGASGNPRVVSAFDALSMATVHGAAALGRNTGMLAVGRDADIIMLDFAKPHLMPCHDVMENVVFSARGSDVCMNMARGQIIYENGQFFTVDMEKLAYELSYDALPQIFPAETKHQ